MRSLKSSGNEGWGKFKHPDLQYAEFLASLDEDPPAWQDVLHHFPCYVGQVNLARFLCLYDLYRKVVDLSGHIGELGVFRGASFVFFAKLVKLFEPYSHTQVFGFDWFEGMTPGVNGRGENKYRGNYEELSELIKRQHLEDTALLQCLDLTRDAGRFLKDRPHLRFKLIYVDCGLEDVLSACLDPFWQRLVPGGILIMDHFNTELSPRESDLFAQVVGPQVMHQLPFTRQPTGYVIKSQY